MTRFWRAILLDENDRQIIFYLYAPDLETACAEAERQTGADIVIVDDCTPRRERIAA